MKSMKNSESKEYDKLFKIILVGDSGVGKSSILSKFCEDKFDNTYVSTIGVDFAFKTMKCGNDICKFQIWDTAGQDRFKSITSTYYRGASGIVLVYDITDKDSFVSLSKWIEEIKKFSYPDIDIIIVGNKLDRCTNRQILYTDAFNFADERKYLYIETSAKNGMQIDSIFEKLSLQLIKNQNFKNSIKEKNINLKGESIKKPCCYYN